MNNIKLLLSVLVAFIIVTQNGCGWKEEDPVAPEKLSITTVSIADGSILISDTLAISWTTNKGGCSYMYKFGETSVWSDTCDTNALDTILSDGEYTFYLQAFLVDEISTIVARTFQIDVVGSPGIYTSPRFIKLKSVDDTISFTIKSKGIDTTNAFSITLPGIKLRYANFTGQATVLASGNLIDGILSNNNFIEGTRDFLTVSALLDSTTAATSDTLHLIPSNVKLSYTKTVSAGLVDYPDSVIQVETEYDSISVRGSFIEVDSLSGGSL